MTDCTDSLIGKLQKLYISTGDADRNPFMPANMAHNDVVDKAITIVRERQATIQTPPVCPHSGNETVQTSDAPAHQILPLVVTKDGVPFKDQAEGIRQFKEACLKAKTTKHLMGARDIAQSGRAAREGKTQFKSESNPGKYNQAAPTQVSVTPVVSIDQLKGLIALALYDNNPETDTNSHLDRSLDFLELDQNRRDIVFSDADAVLLAIRDYVRTSEQQSGDLEDILRTTLVAGYTEDGKATIMDSTLREAAARIAAMGSYSENTLQPACSEIRLIEADETEITRLLLTMMELATTKDLYAALAQRVLKDAGYSIVKRATMPVSSKDSPATSAEKD